MPRKSTAKSSRVASDTRTAHPVRRRKPRRAKVAPTPEPTIPVAPTTQRVRRSVSWPKDWKQAVWERFAPRWALLRWPVRYEERVWWEDAPADGGSVSARFAGTWTPSVPIGQDTTVTLNGKPIGVAITQTAAPGVYSFSSVNVGEPAALPFTSTPEAAKSEGKRVLQDRHRNPRQHGWDDAAAGVYAPDQYGDEGSWDRIAYCYGHSRQLAGYPWPAERE